MEEVNNMNEYGLAYCKDELLTDMGKTKLADIVTDPATGKRKETMKSISGIITIEIYNRLLKYFASDEVYSMTYQAQTYGKYISADSSLVLIYSRKSSTWMVIADCMIYAELLKPTTVKQKQLSMRNRLESLEFCNGHHLGDYEVEIIMSAFKSGNKTDEQKLIELLAKEVLHLSNKVKTEVSS